jgi:rare lipoprotein A
LKTANPVSVAVLLGLTLLAGCAGFVPWQSSAPLTQARGEESDEKAAAETKGDVKSATKRKHAAGCQSGRMVRSAFYWQGRRTASGERFNPDGLTAAHRTLPFGTRLTVTNPRTGKSVEVVINDRGPFSRGLHLDLSRGAARAIGLTGTGTVCISS